MTNGTEYGDAVAIIRALCLLFNLIIKVYYNAHSPTAHLIDTDKAKSAATV